MKTYQLLLICEHDLEQQVHSLHIGTLNQCRAIKLIAKTKEKQFRKHKSIQKGAKITYKIERLSEKK